MTFTDMTKEKAAPFLQPRPKRTYLGIANPVNGERILSSKKPERKPSDRLGPGNADEAIADDRPLYENGEKDFRAKL